MPAEELHHDVAVLRPLAERLLELAARPEEAEKKRLWADHQALRRTPRAPVSLYWEGIPLPQWRRVFGEEFLACRGDLARTLEMQLRRKVWTLENLHDDHIAWPSVQVEYPYTEVQDWGVPLAHRSAGDELGAWAYDPPFKDGIDLARLTPPRREFDDASGRRLIEQANALVGGRLRVNVYYAHRGYTAFDRATEMRGMENLLMDAALDPDGLYALNDFICTACMAHEERREREGRISVWPEPGSPFQEVGMRVHCAYKASDFDARPPRLLDEWTYVHAQTSAGLGPDQYARFVQPFNERFARPFTNHTVYYHGCEPLHDKMIHIARTPNLRRFHVSPWTDLDRAAAFFGDRMVLEVHDHPGDVFFARTPDAIRRHVRDLLRRGRGARMDLNLSDINSFNDDPALLVLWSRIAREESERAA